AYCLKTQPATGETYPKSDLFNKAASMEKLHALNMLSGDPHRGNFIVSKDGVRIIDLSGKSCTAERKARDRLAMERHLGIVNEIKDYGYYSVIYRTKLRKFIKKLKGKA
ncbi:lipopolysaccharide core heptose(II) kinase RfaY, partial [Escherichia coli]|nr:lipopolysaccharide core heptose(II) kinase RfaY [Escherichia coli]